MSRGLWLSFGSSAKLGHTYCGTGVSEVRAEGQGGHTQAKKRSLDLTPSVQYSTPLLSTQETVLPKASRDSRNYSGPPLGISAPASVQMVPGWGNPVVKFTLSSGFYWHGCSQALFFMGAVQGTEGISLILNFYIWETL